MWQPDGWGQTRIGLLTPHADIVPEAEFSALAPDGISIHATRIPFDGYKPGGTMDPTVADTPVRAIADPPLPPHTLFRSTKQAPPARRMRLQRSSAAGRVSAPTRT